MIQDQKTIARICVGVDIVSVERIRQIWQRHGWRLAGDLFTERELKEADITRVTPPHLASAQANRLAVLFSAKEGAAKALGLPHRKSFNWSDIEVTGGTDLAVELKDQSLAFVNGRRAVSLTARSGGTATHVATIVIGELS